MPGKNNGATKGSWVTLRGEERDPETAADVIINYAEGFVLTAEDFEKADKAIESSGLPKRTQVALRRRIREVYGPQLLGAIKDLGRKDFIMAIRSRRAQIINAMTPDKMAEAGIRDLAIAYGTMQDKEALLLGEPTSIMAFERRENVNDLTEKLLKEAQRRGLVDLHKQPDGSYAGEAHDEP